MSARLHQEGRGEPVTGIINEKWEARGGRIDTASEPAIAVVDPFHGGGPEVAQHIVECHNLIVEHGGIDRVRLVLTLMEGPGPAGEMLRQEQIRKADHGKL